MFNGNYLRINDRDLKQQIYYIMQCCDPRIDLNLAARNRNAIINSTLHALGVPPGREQEATCLFADLDRCFDELMMELRTRCAHVSMPVPARVQWGSSLRARL